VAGCCKYDDEPGGYGAMELVLVSEQQLRRYRHGCENNIKTILEK
jgi:hypothetical protein